MKTKAVYLPAPNRGKGRKPVWRDCCSPHLTVRSRPELLQEFAIVGEPQNLAGQIATRYGDIVDRTSAAYAHIGKADRASIIEKLSAI